MKKLTVIILLLCAALTSLASTNWTLQGKAYNVDTVYHAKIGPGTTRTSLELTGGSRLNVFYITVDLTDPYVDVRVTKASDKLTACAPLSSQAKSATKQGAKYFAGVNADFFGNSQPIGSTVVDSEIYYGIGNNWVNWFMTDDKKPGIGTLGFSGTASSSGASHKIAGVNVSRNENCLVIYNQRKGANTGTNAYGYEVTMEPVEGTLSFVGKSDFKVTCAPAKEGSMAIPTGGYVLSGHGTAATFVQNLKAGDVVAMDLNPDLPGIEGKAIRQMASGMPVILSGGVTLDTEGALDHLTALNPRTAVGYDAAKTKLVLLVVDGRGVSAGVVSKVLADIMREVGCTEAMNFDGGGSSELYAADFGVVNTPSDGIERSVTNAVWAVALGEEDDEVAEIRFERSVVELPKYGYYRPVIYAYNKYGTLISKNLTEGVVLSCGDELGEIIENGTTLLANGSGTHALKAHYGDKTAAAVVTIGGGNPEFRVSKTILDNVRKYKVEVIARSSKGIAMELENSALSWRSDNPDVAVVDQNGVVSGIADGEAVIVGSIDDFEGRIAIKVEIPKERRMEIFGEPFNPDSWTLSKVGVKDYTAEPLENHGIALNYTVSSTRGTNVKLKGSAPIYSLPDSLRLVINPGDAKIKQIIVGVTSAEGKEYPKTYTPELKANAKNILLLPVSDFIDVEDQIYYPLSLSSVMIYLSDPVNQPRRIELSSLQGVYVSIPQSGGVNDVQADIEGDALGITPNPVSPGEAVTVGNVGDEPVEVSVFNVSGRNLGNVATDGNTFKAPSVPGLYIVTLTSSGRRLSGKLVVR